MASVFSPEQIYRRTRETRPLVYQLTNRVSMQVQADAVALLGGLSIMSDAREEAAEIAAKSDALLISLGTPRADSYEIFAAALSAAQKKNIPAVFDLVGYGFTAFRTKIADELLREFQFSAIKGNASEIAALAGIGNGPSGVSAKTNGSDLRSVVKELSQKFSTTVFCTGEKDFIADGKNEAVIVGGSSYAASLSGIGCALGSAAALFSVHGGAFHGALAALLAFRSASEQADKSAKGPGTFYRNFQDALASLGSDETDWSKYDGK